MPIDSADPSSSVVEAHPTTGEYTRGVHDFGAALCVDEHFGQKRATGFFSNHTPYVYEDNGKRFSATFGENACYHYDGVQSLAFLAQHGIKLVRLDFRWERLQEKVGGDLRSDDVQHLVDYVHNAEAAGLTPIIDMHNYGHLYIWNKRLKRGVRTAIGSKKLPIEGFTDVWTRLSTLFKSDPKVVYDLMNEPEELDTKSTPGPQVWEQASQAALDAIRANGDNHLIMVEGYDFAAVERWAQIHPQAWIHDPADNFRYEGHHYWDREGSGYYTHTYDEEVADAQARGF
jgi:endoglucanase